MEAKCGEVVGWHWAHARGGDCDSWAENEGDWHRRWKWILVGPHTEMLEVTMPPHRADVVVRGVVIELQHSSLRREEVEERESFYGRMAWLFDGWRWSERIDLTGRKMRWKDPSPMPFWCKAPAWIDLGWQGIVRPRGPVPCFFDRLDQRAFRLRYGVRREGDPGGPPVDPAWLEHLRGL